jgi:membrane-associated protease RseP (regulator of RpoE activity)
LFGALLGSSIVRAQEPPKAEPTAPKPAAESTAGTFSQFKFYAPRKGVQDQKNQTQTVTILRQGKPVQQTRTIQLDPLLHNFGLSLADADDALRAQLEIPPGQGVVVMTIKPESLADQAGLKPKDVILSLRDTPATNVTEVKKTFLSLTQAQPISVKLIREGKPRQLSFAWPKQGIPTEPTEYWIGVGVTPVDSTLRSHLPALVEDLGLIANNVVKDSPAETAGLKQNDILVSLDGKPLKTREEMVAVIQTSEGKSIALEILRAGKPLTLKISPAKRPANIGFSTISFSTISVNPAQIQQSYLANLPYVLLQPYSATLQVDVKTDGKPEPQGDPVRFFQMTPDASSEPIHLEFVGKAITQQADARTARVEAQIKDLSTKLDEIKAILEGLKKPESK